MSAETGFDKTACRDHAEDGEWPGDVMRGLPLASSVADVTAYLVETAGRRPLDANGGSRIRIGSA